MNSLNPAQLLGGPVSRHQPRGSFVHTPPPTVFELTNDSGDGGDVSHLSLSASTDGHSSTLWSAASFDGGSDSHHQTSGIHTDGQAPSVTTSLDCTPRDLGAFKSLDTQEPVPPGTINTSPSPRNSVPSASTDTFPGLFKASASTTTFLGPIGTDRTSNIDTNQALGGETWISPESCFNDTCHGGSDHGPPHIMAPIRNMWPVFTPAAVAALPLQAVDLVRIYDVVRATGVPNFQQARLPLPHALNMPAWRHHLLDYTDHALCDYLEFGWPMNYVPLRPPTPTLSNHGSATAHVQHVLDYVNKETQLGALLGPFEAPPFWPWSQVNPLMTAPKKDSDARRVITDLSWPPAPEFSVNSGIPGQTYMGQPYKLRLPTADGLASLILKHGPGCYLYSVDLSRAFRQLRCDPLDWPLLGSQCEGLFYCDTAIPFGIRWGAMACQRTTSALCYIMDKEADQDCLNYIDDLAGVASSATVARQGFDFLRDLMKELGVVESEHKAIFPCTQMIWIGIEFDSILMQMRMPQHKIEETLALCRSWRTKAHATRSQLQKLLGKIFHIAQCCRPARLFVSRMLDTLRAAPLHGQAALDAEFKKDIEWFLSFLPMYNGIHLMQPEPADITLEVDSCLSGCGGICGTQYYHTTFPDFILDRDLHISQLEMLNVAVAVKLWASTWTNHRVIIYCDNSAAIAVLQSGRGRDHFLLACARQVWYYAARYDCQIEPRHKPGVEMETADSLSRYHLHASYRARVTQLTSSSTYTRQEIDPYLFKMLEH